MSEAQRGATHPHCRRGVVVGIFSRTRDHSGSWLRNFLYQEFPDLVSEVRFLLVSDTNRISWEREVQQCSAGILYLNKHWSQDNMAQLQYLNTALGREKVLVVLDDMKRSDEEEKRRILSTEPRLRSLASHLLLIPEGNKRDAASENRSEIRAFLRRAQRGQISAAHSGHPSLCAGSASSHPSDGFPGFRISIFSRAGDRSFSWLISRLKAEDGMEAADIRGVCISNNYNEFTEEATKCDFSILYHTLRHGRLNITDVTDALYDNELQDLHHTLGREKVLVVADDLKSDDNEEKDRILMNQPSISEYARDLILFTEKQKSSKNLQKITRIIQKCLPKPQVHEINIQQKEKSGLTESQDSPTQKVGGQLAQYGCPYDEAEGHSSKLSASDGYFQKTSSYHEDEEPQISHPKRTSGTTEAKMKEVCRDLSGNLNIGSAEVRKEIVPSSSTGEKLPDHQTERQHHWEIQISKSVQTIEGAVLEKEKRLEKMSEIINRQEKEIQRFTEEMKKREMEKEEQFDKMSEAIKRQEEIQRLREERKNREMEKEEQFEKMSEALTKLEKEIQSVQEEKMKMLSELYERDVEIVKALTELRIMEEKMEEMKKLYTEQKNNEREIKRRLREMEEEIRRIVKENDHAAKEIRATDRKAKRSQSCHCTVS